MMCDECGGMIDQKSGFCISCGLEAINFDETEFVRGISRGSISSGEEETRQRNIRKSKDTYGRGTKGYVCNRCRELFSETSRNESVLELESKIQGYEQPGTNIYTFKLKQDLNEHIRVVHEGKKYADNVHVKLGKFNKETNSNSNQRGQGK